MVEHGAHLEQQFEDKGRQICVRKTRNQNAERNGLFKHVHGKARAPIRDLEDVVDLCGCAVKATSVERIADHLLDTGLVQETFSRNERGLDKDAAAREILAEFDAAVCCARDRLEGDQLSVGTLNVYTRVNNILCTGDLDARQKGRLANTSLSLKSDPS